jgi:galactokinase/mevalonate kinase-like predicted kinase
MQDLLDRLENPIRLPAARQLIDEAVARVRADGGSASERGLLVRGLVLNQGLLDELSTAAALAYLRDRLRGAEWDEVFGPAVGAVLPTLLADVVDRLADAGHAEVLALLPAEAAAPLLAALERLDAYLDSLSGSPRLLRGMRVARIQADLYRRLAAANGPSPVRLPRSGLDDDAIQRLKQEARLEALPAAYEARVNQLQREDLQASLAALGPPAGASAMRPQDHGRTFAVESPLRLGLSSANASDNHLRTKERGGKTLNVGIYLRTEGQRDPSPPLRATGRRLPEPRLVLRSLSSGFEAELELTGSDPAGEAERFFAYRRGGDEALRLVKQALVHTGIVPPRSSDVVGDVAAFTGGGGLEIATSSQVIQGSGLGTSSILAAVVLKLLYRMAGNPIADPAGEYPALYDQSLLLEQSLGLNSGWQDARGACGGPSAVKDFYAAPTLALPDPAMTFIPVDEREFVERVVLFNTGIARAATRGLNVVLDAYLTRDHRRYPAVRESLAIHDRMVACLRAGDWTGLGRLATRYWQLRCILDPGATDPTLQLLFEDPALAELSEGGLLTGAGGGGFAVLFARAGQGDRLKERLAGLRRRPPYASSGVVEYRLAREGLRLRE